MSVLSVSGLSTGYNSPTRAISDISIEVRAGRMVALIGANGAGKSTTLNAISGVLRPWNGHIKFDDRDLAGANTSTVLRAGIAQVPEGRRILPGLTVSENLAMGGYAVGRQKSEQALSLVLELFPALGRMLKRPGGLLSGGEQQMLAIGRALMSSPKVLMLDEPSLGLAPRIVDRIFEHVTSLKERGMAVLVVEQNASLALELADFAYVIERGRIVLEGPAADIAANPKVKESYVGV